MISNIAPLKEVMLTHDGSGSLTPNTPTVTKDVKIDPLRYKTKHCRHFSDHGTCPFQSRCVFAHGQPELRTQEDNQKAGITTDQALKDYINAKAAKEQQTAPALFTTPPRSPTAHSGPTTPTTLGQPCYAKPSTFFPKPPTPEYDSYRHNPYSFQPYTYIRSSGSRNSTPPKKN